MKRLITLATLSILSAACGNNDATAPRARAAEPIEEDSTDDSEVDAIERKMLTDGETVTAEEPKPGDEAKTEDAAKVEESKDADEKVAEEKRFPCRPTGKILKDLRARAKAIRQSSATKEEKRERLKALRAEGRELIKAERERIKACRKERRAAKTAD